MRVFGWFRGTVLFSVTMKKKVCLEIKWLMLKDTQHTEPSLDASASPWLSICSVHCWPFHTGPQNEGILLALGFTFTILKILLFQCYYFESHGHHRWFSCLFLPLGLGEEVTKTRAPCHSSPARALLPFLGSSPSPASR